MSTSYCPVLIHYFVVAASMYVYCLSMFSRVKSWGHRKIAIQLTSVGLAHACPITVTRSVTLASFKKYTQQQGHNCMYSVVPRPSPFFSSVCVQYNVWKWKSGEKWGRPRNTHE